MEFDLEAFTSDVAAALRYKSPHSQTSKHSYEYEDGGLDSQRIVVDPVLDPAIQAPKRRRLASRPETRGSESFGRGLSLLLANDGGEETDIDNNELVSESDDGFVDDLQSFLHPSEPFYSAVGEKTTDNIMGTC
jgi:hypothetical protein